MRIPYLSTRCLLGVLGILFILPFPVAAQSSADIQAQIEQLTQIISILQARIVAQGGQASVAPTQTTSTLCIDIPVDLKPNYFDIGGPGPISRLQEFLKASGDYSREITGYYGPVTTAAVQKWQARHGLVSSGSPESNGYGAVGPRTRAAMRGAMCENSVSGSSNTQATIIPRTATTPVQVPTPVVITPEHPSCLFGGAVVPSGSSVRGYSRATVAPTESCEQYSVVRTCNAGTLTGSPTYAYSACTRSAAGSCVFGGLMLANGESRAFFSTSTAPFGQSCSLYSQQRTCLNGVLDGPANFAFAGCVSGSASSCVLDGQTVLHGTSREFFTAAVVPVGSTCAGRSVVRTCSNGYLSGSGDYRFASCSAAATSTCSVAGITMQSGTSRQFFSQQSAGTNSRCSNYATTRSCTNGMLSGDASFQYASCADASSCVLDDIVLVDGGSRTFYGSRTPPAGQRCSSNAGTRTCSAGVLGGTATYQYGTCTDSCTLDGVTLSEAASSTFYLARNIPSTEQCSAYALKRTCTNGLFAGNDAYKYSSCVRAAVGKCVLDNVVLSSGASGVFYSVSQAPAGKICSAYRQTRTCTNGVLNGTASYMHAVCTDDTSCTIAGSTFTDGQSVTLYKVRSVPYGQLCSANDAVRTCINGSFNGDATYQYLSCSVNPPVSFASPVSQLAAVGEILETILDILRNGR
jgi:peptidoglycan hydrolase-like protein with peptidoglycan-binding domain